MELETPRSRAAVAPSARARVGRMALSSTLRLDRLTLKNFRCFADCAVDLHPHLTVLVAENGRGKTTVLDAIGIALGLLVDTISEVRQSHGFERTDVRLARAADGTMAPALPTVLEAYGSVDGQRLRWSYAVKSLGKRVRTVTGDAEGLRRAAQGLRDRLEGYAAGGREHPPPLPIVAFYGTGRLWSEHRLTEGKRAPDPSTMGRVYAYLDCLSPSSSFKTFVAWYEHTVGALQGAQASAHRGPDRPERLLAAVRKATRIVLEPTGWRDIDWDMEQGHLVVEHPDHGRLPLSVLSDGVRNMIALVADLAHRCVRLNPHFGEAAAELTPGILLIDEVDMHLHPRWQQLVIELLRRAFPAMQIVVSTHSPHVLSTVDVDSIRIIRVRDGEGSLETPGFQTRGAPSDDALAAVMGVDPVPWVEEARLLSNFRAHIESGDVETPEAQAVHARLVAHFGQQHPLMRDCDRLLRFQAFKRRRSTACEKEA